jgi:hypothetical protein
MDTATLFLGAGQLVLTLAVGYLTYLLRREFKRSSLADLVSLLTELRDKNTKALATFFTLMSSEDFKNGDAELRAGLIDSSNRLRAIQAATTEALLHIVHQCDAEWGLAGRLHASFRSHLDALTDKDPKHLLSDH